MAKKVKMSHPPIVSDYVRHLSNAKKAKTPTRAAHFRKQANMAFNVMNSRTMARAIKAAQSKGLH